MRLENLDANNVWRSLTRRSYEARFCGLYVNGILGTPAMSSARSLGRNYRIITAFPGLDLGLDLLEAIEKDC